MRFTALGSGHRAARNGGYLIATVYTKIKKFADALDMSMAAIFERAGL